MTRITYITHIKYITHTMNLISKAYRKTNKTFFIVFFLYRKMTNNYCQKHKERLRKEARKKYQNLSEEEKDKR